MLSHVCRRAGRCWKVEDLVTGERIGFLAWASWTHSQLNTRKTSSSSDQMEGVFIFLLTRARIRSSKSYPTCWTVNNGGNGTGEEDGRKKRALFTINISILYDFYNKNVNTNISLKLNIEIPSNYLQIYARELGRSCFMPLRNGFWAPKSPLPSICFSGLICNRRLEGLRVHTE